MPPAKQTPAVFLCHNLTKAFLTMNHSPRLLTDFLCHSSVPLRLCLLRLKRRTHFDVPLLYMHFSYTHLRTPLLFYLTIRPNDNTKCEM